MTLTLKRISCLVALIMAVAASSPGAQPSRRLNVLFLIAEPLRNLVVPHTNDRNPDRMLRIGYVSADLREHAVGRFFLPLLRAHDQKQFAAFCYSAGQVEDPDLAIGLHGQLADVTPLVGPVEAFVGHPQFGRIGDKHELSVCGENRPFGVVEGVSGRWRAICSSGSRREGDRGSV